MSDPDRFEEALDQLQRGQSPKKHASAMDENERRMMQMAQLLKGAVSEAGPDSRFTSQMRAKLAARSGEGLSRRTAVIGGLGAIAAGVAAGMGLDRSLENSRQAGGYAGRLVDPAKGSWIRVFRLDEVPEGSLKTFQTDSLAGYLIRDKRGVWAYSRACTHMGCLVEYQDRRNVMVCPCHGAVFAVNGVFKRYPDRGGTLPPLPRIEARIRGGGIEVFSA